MPNDYLLPSLVLNINKSVKTIPIAIQFLKRDGHNQAGGTMMAVLCSLQFCQLLSFILSENILIEGVKSENRVIWGAYAFGTDAAARA